MFKSSDDTSVKVRFSGLESASLAPEKRHQKFTLGKCTIQICRRIEYTHSVEITEIYSDTSLVKIS